MLAYYCNKSANGENGERVHYTCQGEAYKCLTGYVSIVTIMSILWQISWKEYRVIDIFLGQYISWFQNIDLNISELSNINNFYFVYTNF